MHSRAPFLLFIALLLGMDAVAIAAFRDVTGDDNHSISLSPIAEEEGWALCQTRFRDKPVSPITVAVTYLDAGLDSQVTPAEIRTWFGDVDGMVIDVYKLVQSDGKRRISFELPRSKWPDWDRAAGPHSGSSLCAVIRAQLLRAGIGRPRLESSKLTAPDGADAGPTDSHLDRSRHDFEFIYARRPALYRSIEWIGTLDDILELDAFTDLQRWLRGDAR